jgi:aspartate aminotransferase-like enzyme
VLVLDNGAYCKRLGKLATLMGRKDDDPAARRGPAGLAAELEAKLQRDPSISHVGFIHCETGTGVANPLQAVADVCARHGKGLIVDAMSSFAALPIDAREVKFDALVAASGKCLEGVPGMGFVFIRKDVLDAAAATRIRWRWTCTTSTSTWRRRASGASRRRPTSSPRSPRRCASSRRRAASRRGWRATRATTRRSCPA